MISLSSLAVLVIAVVWLLVKQLRTAPAEQSPIHLSFSDLWKWHGTVDRGQYAFVGVVGFAVKHNIDRIIATSVFDRRFTPFNYWIPPVEAIRIDRLSTGDARFLLTMVLCGLPFIWIGLAMTIRRLRSANLPLWLAALFFVPVLNLAFFALLSGVQRLGTYGWGVFVALPFCFGLVSVLIYSYHQPRTLSSCLAVSGISVAIVSMALFAVAVEGLICIIMALPIVVPLSLLGGFVGFLVQRHAGMPTEAPSMMFLMMLVPFGVMGAEKAGQIEPSTINVHTSIQIDAPAVKVWKHLLEFPDVQAPPTSLFRFGVSYPIRARICS
ncbi:MAG TPA: hypothetical protein VGK77_03985 [Candidatus Binatia bacterium]|jgi:uncharacterized membrane protein YhaH (DUF805 family)